MQAHRWIFAMALTLGALAGCGSDGPTSGATDTGGGVDDSGGATDVDSADLGGFDDTGADASDAGGSDTGTDAAVDAAPDSTEDAGPCDTLGCPCDDDDACASGFCVDAPDSDDGVCAELCEDTCTEPGFECRTLVNVEGDVVRLCVPANNPWCDACETASDCGSLDAACYPLDDGERACLVPCDDASLCPAGASCTSLTTDSGEGRFCLPDTGLCAGCIDEDGDLHGVGPDCLGPDPDDLDETVYDGAPELCDRRDNDGNGEIDEGFDLQTNPDHCGACGTSCAVESGASACVDGACVYTACPDGLADCDGDFANGCEADLSDPTRCGTCLVPEAPPGDACGTCDTGAWTCGDDGDTTCVGDAGDAALNACGGCETLDDVPGDPCGTCGSGAQVCTEDGGLVCSGDAGDEARNACGGCDALDEGPGDACGTCGSGRLLCATPEALTCVDDAGDAARNACGGCAELEGVPGEPCGACGTGRWLCDGEDGLTCAGDDGDEAFNACGGCDALDDEPGDACGTCGSGTFACATRELTVCIDDEGDDALNACGGCADLAVAPDTTCGTCGLDAYVCDGGDATVCSGDTRVNACGGCAPLDVEPGVACGPCGTDRTVCDGADATVCAITTNCPPSAPEIELQPDPATHLDTLLCAILAPSTDPNPGDVVSYRYAWTVDDAPAPADRVDGARVLAPGAGETWSCTVTPFDGTDEGPSVTSDEVDVANHCADGLRSGTESDVDCGGAPVDVYGGPVSCARCELGDTCATTPDCAAGLACIDGTCAPAFCGANERVASNVCVPCAAGRSNAAGDDASGADTACDNTPCPANSTGANVAAGCTCNAGFTGTITATTTAPYYSGGCAGPIRFDPVGAPVSWTVPAGATAVRIEARGSRGGPGSTGGVGGNGAVMIGTFAATGGTTLTVYAGAGASSSQRGGDCSYVALGEAAWIVAGGGGGAGYAEPGTAASTSTSGTVAGRGTTGSGTNGAAGSSGGGGNAGNGSWGTGGGGGWSSAGGNGGGSAGGVRRCGGSGGSTYAGGAGGGYSGGGGAAMASGWGTRGGGGGGSFNAGSSQSNSVGHAGNGYVLITPVF